MNQETTMAQEQTAQLHTYNYADLTPAAAPDVKPAGVVLILAEGSRRKNVKLTQLTEGENEFDPADHTGGERWSGVMLRMINNNGEHYGAPVYLVDYNKYTLVIKDGQLQSVELAAVTRARESIKGFADVSVFNRPAPDTQFTKSPWSVFSEPSNQERLEKVELYFCGAYDIPEGAVPDAEIVVNRAVNPVFFVDNVRGLVFAVIKRSAGTRFHCAHVGFAPVCEKVGPYRTCVHTID